MRAMPLPPLLLLSLTACGPTGQLGALGETPELTGTIESWTGGAGQVAVEAASSGGMFQVLATGPVDADGRFRVRLPGAAAMEPFLTLYREGFKSAPTSGVTCTGEPAIAPPALKTAGVSLTLSSATVRQAFLSYLTPRSVSPITDYSFVYADRDATVMGERTCSGSLNGRKHHSVGRYSVLLGRGWNLEHLTVTGEGEAVTIDVTSEVLLAGARWYQL